MTINFIHRLLMSFNGFFIWNWYQHRFGSDLHMMLIPEYDERLIVSLNEVISRCSACENNIIIANDNRSLEELNNSKVKSLKSKRSAIDCLLSYYLYNPNTNISIVSLEYPIGRNGNNLIGLKGLSCDQLVETILKEIG